MQFIEQIQLKMVLFKFYNLVIIFFQNIKKKIIS